MTICFHLNHPAHYHLFKNIIVKLMDRNEVLVTYNDKDVLRHLIENDKEYNFNNYRIKSHRRGKGVLSLINEFVQKEFGLYNILKIHKPDLIVGTSVIVAHVAKLLNTKSLIVNEDDFDVISKTARIGYPFADNILSPECCRSWKFKGKTITYNSFHELAYLAPKYFLPQKKYVNSLTKNDEKYFILRFSSLAAHHDIGKKGISEEIALKLVELLAKYGNVYITSEKKLNSVLDKYRIKIDPIYMHHVLYYSDLYIGDSQTMAAEAAILGTPSIRFNDFVGKLSYLEELEHKYRLTYGIKTNESEKLINKVSEMLSYENLKDEWNQRRNKMLDEKIDTTDYMTWFIENYPQSVEIMRKNREYQYIFK